MRHATYLLWTVEQKGTEMKVNMNTANKCDVAIKNIEMEDDPIEPKLATHKSNSLSAHRGIGRKTGNKRS